MTDGRSRSGPLIAGSLVDHYAIIRFIARGGMGDVYLARDTRLGRKVALKVISAGRVEAAKDLAAILFEARATATFNHPHIVTLYGLGEHEGYPYLALEYLEGSTLRERMRGDPAGLRESWRIGQAIAEALDEAHRHQVLHLDLKPENIMVPRDGRLRVLDFGLARLRGVGASPSDSPRGTPLYMAPEQWRGELPTAATDIWALGIILFELATGRRPYARLPVQDLAAEVGGPIPVEKLAGNAELPADFTTLIDRCLAKDPARRPTASEVVATLAGLLAPGRVSRGDRGNPFRGLLPFNEQHAELFHGRDAEIAELLERLRDSTVLPVVGVSGAGKSSFVKAGVVPRLREQGLWTVLGVRPGHAPFRSLAAALAAGEVVSGSARSASDPTRSLDAPGMPTPPSAMAPADIDELARDLAAAPEQLGQWLRRRAARDRSQILLVIDQLEEVVTLVADDDLRARFLRAICLAADDERDPVRVIFTVRDDFLGRIADVPEMRAALRQVTVLQCPGPQALEEILVKPLAAAGYRYDDPSLVAEMMAAVRGESAALPLLQFVLQMLWEARDVEARVVTRAAYAALGGVAGALAARADQVLAGLSEGEVATARQILLRLVTRERTRRVVTRRQLVENLPPGAAEVLERLTGARLVVPRSTRGRSADEPELELVHESLVHTWARLARWLDEGREDLALLADLGQAAELWARHGRRADDAWQGEPLAQARRALTADVAVPGLVREFVGAGERRERRRRLRRRITLAGALVLLGGIAVTSLTLAVAFSRKNAQIEDKQRDAEHSRAGAELEAASRALAAGDNLVARANLRSALETEDAPLGRALWGRLRREPLLWLRPTSGMGMNQFTPGGLIEMGGGTASGEMILARADTAEAVRVFKAADLASILVSDMAADGKLLVVGSPSGEIGLFDVASGAFRLISHEREWPAVRLSRDGRMLATNGRDGAVKIFDTASGRLLADLGPGRNVGSFEFSADGKLLVSCDADHGILVSDVATGATLKTLGDPASQLHRLSLRADGTLAAVGKKGLVRLWNVATGEVVADLVGHHGNLYAVAFSADGTHLATGGADTDVLVWNLATRTVESRLPNHAGPVGAVAFSPDGTRLVSSADGLRMWDLTVASADGASIVDSAYPDPVSMAFSQDGARLATWYRDHTIRIWDARSARVERILRNVPGADLAFSADGAWLASPATAGLIKVWDVGSGDERVLGIAAPGGIWGLTFGLDGSTLAAIDRTGRIHLIDRVSGAESKQIDIGEYPIVDLGGSGKLRTWASDNILRVWDTASGKQQQALPIPGDIYRGTIVPDQNIVFVAGRDGVVRRVDPASHASLVVGHSTGNIFHLCVSQDGRRVAAVGDGTAAFLWDLDTGVEIALPMLTVSGECEFSGDGNQLATTSDALRLWDATTGAPLWRAPILRASGELLTQLGWIDLPTGAVIHPAASHWRQALAESAVTASESEVGQILCLATYDHQIAMWSLATDERLWSVASPDFDQVVALPTGCAVRAKNEVRLYDRAGAMTPLATDAVYLGLDHGQLLLAGVRGTRIFAADGHEAASYPGVPGVTAAARVGERLALGHGDGSIELVSTPASAPSLTPPMADHPDSGVVRIEAGPAGSLIAGFANGYLGVWDIQSGVLFAHAQLHGVPRHWLQRGDELYAASDLGDREVIDLAVVSMSTCALLHEVWDHVPMVWDAGAARSRPPPADHPCVRR